MAISLAPIQLILALLISDSGRLKAAVSNVAAGTHVVNWRTMIYDAVESPLETPPPAPTHSLAYRTSPHQTGKVSAYRHDEGTDLIIRQNLSLSLGCALLLFLIFLLILWTLFLPSGRSQYGGVSIEIPEHWTSRAAAVFVVLILPFGIYGTIQHAFIPTTLRCRADGVSCLTPGMFRRRKVVLYERWHMVSVNVGEERGDSVTHYVAMVDLIGMAHRLPLDSLTREESLFIGEELWWGLQATPQDRVGDVATLPA